MARFKYVARDRYGSTIRGTYDALNERQVRTHLRRNNLETVSVKRSLLHMEINFGPPVKTYDLTVFTRMFSSMMKASVPLDEALRVLYEQAERPALKASVQDVLVDVESGEALSDSLEKHRDIFGPLFINMVRAGEMAGSLDTLLDRLADLLERIEAVRSKVRGAMTYPIILFFMAIGAVTVLLTFVIPQFVTLFMDVGVELPTITIVTLAVSEFLSNYWWTLIFAAGGLGYLAKRLLRNPKVRERVDRILLKIPAVGEVVRKGAIARFTRTFSTLLYSGLGLLESLDLSRGTLQNTKLEKAVSDAAVAIRTGSEVAPPLKRSEEFPPLVTSMIAIGEQSGDLDAMLDKVADFYEDDVNRAVDSALKLVEPVMLVFMGALVGIILAAIYLPLFEMIAGVADDG